MSRVLVVLVFLASLRPAAPVGAAPAAALTPVVAPTTPTVAASTHPSASAPAITTCPVWDVNCDGIADMLDITLIGKYWGQKGPPHWLPEDANGDGVIDINDVVAVGLHLNQSWGGRATATNTPVGLPTVGIANEPANTTTSTRVSTTVPTATQVSITRPTDVPTVLARVQSVPSGRLVAPSAPVESGASIAVSPALENVNVGQQFSVQVNLDTGTALSRGATAGLIFDPTVVQVADVTVGTFFSDWAAQNGATATEILTPVIDNVAGTVSDVGVGVTGGVSGTGASGSGTFVTYTLNAIATGTTTLQLSDAAIDDPNGAAIGDATITNGGVTVSAALTATPTSSLSPTSTDSPTITETETVVGLTDTPTGSDTPTVTSTPTATECPTATATVTPGSTVTATPTVTASATECVGPTLTPTTSLTSTASTTSSPIDSVTMTATPTISASPTSSATSTITASGTSTSSVTSTATSTVDPLPTLTLGPTNTTAPTLTPSPAPTTGATLSISPSSPVVSVGDTFTVTLNINTGTTSSRGATAAISFDPNILQVQSVSPGTFFSNWANANAASTLEFPVGVPDNVNGVVPDTGVSILGGTPFTGPQGTGTFLTYSVTAKAAGTSALTISDLIITDPNSNTIPDAKAVNGTVTVAVTCTPTCTPTVTSTATPTATLTPTITLTPCAPTCTPTPSPTSTIQPTSGVPTNTSTPAPTTGATLSVSPASTNVNLNDTFTLNVSINTGQISGVPVPSHGGEVKVSFDPTILQVLSVSQGTFYSAWASSNAPASTLVFPDPTPDNTNGDVPDLGVALLSAPIGGGPSGSGIFATYTVKAIKAGTSAITLSDVIVDFADANGEHMPDATGINGQVVVGVATSTPDATPTVPTSTPTITQTRTVTQTPTFTISPTLTVSATSTQLTPLTAGPTITTTPYLVGASLIITPAATTVNLNDSFDVSVIATGGSEQIRAASAAISFDHTILKVNTITEGPYFTGWASSNGAQTVMIPTATPDNNGGTVSEVGDAIIGGPSGQGPSGPGVFLIYNFTAIGTGTSQITLTDGSVSEASVSAPGGGGGGQTKHIHPDGLTATNGSVTVGGTPTTGTPGTGTPTPTLGLGTPSVTPTITPTPGLGTPSVTPTIAGSVTATNGAPPSPTSIASIIPTKVASLHTSVSLSPLLLTPKPGDKFTVDVVLNTDKTSRGSSGGLTFDPKLVQVDSVEEGAFYKSWAGSNGASTITFPKPSPDNVNGKVSDIGVAIVSGPPSVGPGGQGVLWTYHLTAKADGKGHGPLTLVNVVITDPNGTQLSGVTLVNAMVYVGEAPPVGAQATAEAQATQVSAPIVPDATGAITSTVQTASGATGAAGAPASGTAGAAGAATGTNGTLGSAGPAVSGDAKQAQISLAERIGSDGVTTEDLNVTALGSRVRVQIPKGTLILGPDGSPLATSTGIQVSVATPPREADRPSVGLVYDFEPAGTTFSPPILVTIPYDPAKIPKGSRDVDLTVATYDEEGGSWSDVDAIVDPSNRSVIGEVSHFSSYSVVPQAPALDMGFLAGIWTFEVFAGAAVFLYITRRRYELQLHAQNNRNRPQPRGGSGTKRIADVAGGAPGVTVAADRPPVERAPPDRSLTEPVRLERATTEPPTREREGRGRYRSALSETDRGDTT